MHFEDDWTIFACIIIPVLNMSIKLCQFPYHGVIPAKAEMIYRNWYSATLKGGSRLRGDDTKVQEGHIQENEYSFIDTLCFRE